MRFPKPLVYLGFLLIAAAVLGSVYEAIFKEDKQVREEQPSPKELAAEMILDKLFDQLQSELRSDNIEVHEDIFADLKGYHKKVYVNKYVYIAEELERKKHTEKESQEINDNFNKSTLANLRHIYEKRLTQKNNSKAE